MSKKGGMKVLWIVALVLLIIGGLNWGLVGLLNVDLVALIFGVGIAAQVVYILVGLSAVYVGLGKIFWKHHKK